MPRFLLKALAIVVGLAATGLADCVLVPQSFTARRLDSRLDHVPTVMRVFDACMAEPAFASTQPSACPDAA